MSVDHLLCTRHYAKCFIHTTLQKTILKIEETWAGDYILSQSHIATKGQSKDLSLSLSDSKTCAFLDSAGSS